MQKLIAKKLEEINKLIFVKRYHEAERKLEDTLELPEGASEIIIHLRRIELAILLKKTDKLKSQYIADIKTSLSLDVAELCLALLDLHSDKVKPAESIVQFQEIIKRHGPSAAAYYGIGYAMEQQSNIDRAIYNYEQCLSQDQDWYVAYFGLSQIYYQSGDEKKGDHYFYLFEQAAPHNVYGNFETHRKLYKELLEAERLPKPSRPSGLWPNGGWKTAAAAQPKSRCMSCWPRRKCPWNKAMSYRKRTVKPGLKAWR